MQILLLVSRIELSHGVNSSHITGGGVDYDSGPFTVTFPVGVTSVSFDIPINNNNILEVDEDFTLTIVHGTLPNGVTRGSIGQATVTIMDDDSEKFIYTLCLSKSIILYNTICIAQYLLRKLLFVSCCFVQKTTCGWVGGDY